MLTLNAADEPIWPGGHPFYFSTNTAAAQPMTYRVTPINSAAANPMTITMQSTNVNGAQTALSWLRVDRFPTVPLTGTGAAGGNVNITYAFPREPR